MRGSRYNVQGSEPRLGGEEAGHHEIHGRGGGNARLSDERLLVGFRV